MENVRWSAHTALLSIFDSSKRSRQEGLSLSNQTYFTLENIRWWGIPLSPLLVVWRQSKQEVFNRRIWLVTVYWNNLRWFASRTAGYLQAERHLTVRMFGDMTPELGSSPFWHALRLACSFGCLEKVWWFVNHPLCSSDTVQQGEGREFRTWICECEKCSVIRLTS